MRSFSGHEGAIAKSSIANRCFAKLAHVVNFEHWADMMSIADLLREFAPAAMVEEAKLAHSIASISDYNSVAVARKADTMSAIRPGRCVSAGAVAVTYDGVPGFRSGDVTSLNGLHESTKTA